MFSVTATSKFAGLIFKRDGVFLHHPARGTFVAVTKPNVPAFCLPLVSQGLLLQQLLTKRPAYPLALMFTLELTGKVGTDCGRLLSLSSAQRKESHTVHVCTHAASALILR